MSAQAVLLDYKAESKINHSYMTLYLYKLKSFGGEGSAIAAGLTKINLFLVEQEEYVLKVSAKNNAKVKNENNFSNLVKNDILSECQKVLSTLYRLSNPIYFDVYFLLLQEAWQNKEDGLLKLLSGRLYKELGEKSPPSLKLAWGYYLFMDKKYNDASKIFSSVLCVEKKGHEFFRVPHNYSFFTGSLIGNKKYKEALEHTEYALTLQDSFPLKWNAATLCVSLGKFDEDTLKYFRTIASMSLEDKKEHGISNKLSNLTYEAALQKAGKTEELAEVLLAKQKKALEESLKRQKLQGQRVKELINLEQEERREQQEARRKINEQSTAKTQQGVTPINAVGCPENDAPQDYAPQPEDEKYVAPLQRVKKKTRGAPDEKADVHSISQQPEVIVEHKTINDLTKNKNACETFNTLFEIHTKKSPDDPICFTNKAITLTDVKGMAA